MSSLAVTIQKLVAIALCAWGIVVILEIGALAGAALLGHDPQPGGSGLGEVMIGTWAVVSAQLCATLMGRRPASSGEG
jgi:hypothetical protein